MAIRTYVDAPTGTLTKTVTPTIVWRVADEDTLDRKTQIAYHLKIYNADDTLLPGFNPETTPAAWDSGEVSSTTLQRKVPIQLDPGSYSAYVKAKPLVTGVFTVWGANSFVINPELPPAPTVLLPANLSGVDTDTPLLGTRISDHWTSQRVQWQLALDPGFSTEVRTHTQDGSRLALGPRDVYENLPGTIQLFTGTWYIRARSIDSIGAAGAWSTANSFTVLHPPTVAGQSPKDETWVYPTAGNLTLSWVPFDTSPLDVQTAYQILVHRASDDLLIVDTGKVSSQAIQAVVNIPATYKDQQLKWRVKLWDSDDTEGPYSADALFTVADSPTVTISTPASGAEVNNPTPAVSASFSAGGDRTLAYWGVMIQDEFGDILYDTGYIRNESDTTLIEHQTGPNPILFLDATFYLTVYVRDSAGLHGSKTHTITAEWEPPAAPTATINATQFDSVGAVELAWTNDEIDADFVEWRVYRRLKGDTAWDLVDSTDSSAASIVFLDYLPPAGEASEWAVVQVVNRFETLTESAYNPIEATPIGTHYWLIHAEDPNLNMRLSQVISDPHSEEYEEETLVLLGRGRKLDRGSRLGIVGTLTCQFRDEANRTAREMKQQLLAIKTEPGALYLRNPFGDVWQVALGQLDFNRISGVGMNEYLDVTIPYFEVS